jgi:hypothetical protein
MTIRHYLMNACQDDARRAGERDRLLLEARRAREARRERAGLAATARRLVRLLVRPRAAAPSRFRASPEQTGPGQVPASISPANSP